MAWLHCSAQVVCTLFYYVLHTETHTSNGVRAVLKINMQQKI